LDTDFARRQIGKDSLIVFELEIYGAVLAKGGNGHASFRIEGDQPVTRRHIEDAFLLAIGPIGDAAAGELPWSGRTTGAFMLAMHPQLLARGRVEGNHRSARSRGRIENSIDHQRRTFQAKLRARTEVIGLETPGDFQLVEVRRVDLIQRAVFAV